MPVNGKVYQKWLGLDFKPFQKCGRQPRLHRAVRTGQGDCGGPGNSFRLEMNSIKGSGLRIAPTFKQTAAASVRPTAAAA